ncbi:hypothetical protein J627_3784 [Acinetobacter sp. 1245593]|nr:hypothetical protein J627_3784 [Acinetobacter sp. 1245593]
MTWTYAVVLDRELDIMTPCIAVITLQKKYFSTKRRLMLSL